MKVVSMINVIIILISLLCLGGQRDILILASEEDGRVHPGLAEPECANASSSPASELDHSIGFEPRQRDTIERDPIIPTPNCDEVNPTTRDKGRVVLAPRENELVVLLNEDKKRTTSSKPYRVEGAGRASSETEKDAVFDNLREADRNVFCNGQCQAL